MYFRSPLTAFAPVATDGIRPCTELNPCDALAKYAGVLEEHPMPLSFDSLCGGMLKSNAAWTIAPVIESCPHPAQSVDMPPS